ncbi:MULTISPECIES: DUF1090 domain-containing protein [unclassified Serratia (in: enterobacteria)]|uniref:DUF1090 domain-containing protein n=1 Tax=unclassified Serratia (in: enterobacteria) TaxID=2647522 RepID=UPI00307665C5
MKLRHTLLLAVPLLAYSVFSSATSASGCAQKAQAIQTQIDKAKQYGNRQRVEGLEKALGEVQNHCTEAGLEAERQQKIAEKQNKVAEREQELQEARQAGKADKVAAKQRKLAEAQAELKAAQAK